MEFVKERVNVVCLTVWVQPTCTVKAHSWACSKGLQCKFFHLIRSDQSMERSNFSMRSVPKLAAISLGSDLGVWDTLKLTKQKRRKAKAIRPCCELKQNRELKQECNYVWVRERAKHRKERASAGGAVRKIERNSDSVREWKRKRRLFSLLKLHM